QERLTDWSQLRGQVVVLEFWATWCDACREARPHLNALAERFQDRPVRFISITDETEPVVRAYLRKNPIAGWVGLDETGSVFEAFGVYGRPLTLIIDREGRVAGQTFPSLLGPETIEAALAGRDIPLRP
ncbi:MAG: TlpA disulfide reductase family protein, partial [Elusimicrobia bacterium]|nr:TlpA disulfide reductase family protein [Elusimicrobiota bacterium]